MIKITAASLLDLLPSSIKSDAQIQYAAQALDAELQLLNVAINECLILSRVDELAEEVLDQLAYDLHVEWYDATADIAVKRALIKNSDLVHRYLGTPYAVKQVIQDYFGDGTVEEWFDYEGDPYHFRVQTENSAITGALAEQFARAVEKVKNTRSIMDSVIVTMSADMSIYIGHVVHIGDTTIIKQVV